jgi:hypothetical protein
MLRVLTLVLALGVAIDHFALDGRYAAAAQKVIYLLLHRV